MNTKDTPIVFVLGPSWYGGWAKDFHEALVQIGVDARLIYTNTAGGVDFGNVRNASTGLVTGLKNVLYKYAPWLVRRIKIFLKWRSELALMKEVQRLLVSGREVVIFFTWTPPGVSTLERLKKTKAKLVLWQGEAPCREETWAKSFPYFDHIFVIDKDWLQFLSKDVWDKVSVLQHASSTARYYPCKKNSKFICDVAMVGLYRKERAEQLAVLRDYDLRIYGYNWEEGFDIFPWLKDKYFGPASAEEVNQIFNSARIVIGSNGMGTPDFPGYTITQRTYDIPLAGNFQLSVYAPAAIPAFDNTVIMFHDNEELKRLVEYYLEHPEEREGLAKKAHKIALERHTYPVRAREMMVAIGYKEYANNSN